MMPTLRQIKRLNQLLLDLYVMKIPPEVIKFSRRGNKPFIMISAEPMHDIKKVRWFEINSEGDLDEE